jgi:HEAT repeat protein
MDRRDMLGLLLQVPFAGLLPGLALGGSAGETVPAVGEVGDLIRQLEGTDLAQRCLALIGLCKLGPQASPALPTLTRLLADEGEPMRTVAGFAIGQIATDEIEPVEGLLAMLRQASAMNRGHAALGLGVWAGRNPTPSDLRNRTIEELLALCHHPDGNVRSFGFSALLHCASEDPPIFPALVEGLHDPEENVRYQAAVGLQLVVLGRGSVQGAEPAIPALMALLESKQSRAAAACVLSALGEPALGALPRIVALLDDPSFRLIAMDALQRFAVVSPVAREHLRRATENADTLPR